MNQSDVDRRGRRRHRRGRGRRRSCSIAAAVASDSSTAARSHDRAAHRPARPGRRREPPARDHGEGQQHQRQHAGRHRPGRRRLRGGGRGRTTRASPRSSTRTRPNKVGPVRSVRLTDPSIVWPIGGVFVFSGGAQYALDGIDQAPVEAARRDARRSMMFRDDSAEAPYNLWAHVDQMFKAEKDAKPVPPPPLFTYRKAEAHAVWSARRSRRCTSGSGRLRRHLDMGRRPT